jgi:hypothetical protein
MDLRPIGIIFLRPAGLLAQAANVATEAMTNVHARDVPPASTINLQTMSDIPVDLMGRASMDDVTYRLRDIMRTTAPLLLLLAAAAPASADTETKRTYSAKDLTRIAALTPEHFRQTASLSDDQLEPIATITTDRGYSSRGRFTDRVRSDNFFRALIDKANGRTIYQLYAEVTYNFAWRRFASASVLLGGRPQALALTVISREVVTCTSLGCAYRETVAIPLTEAQVAEIASGGGVGGTPLWPYRLRAQNGIHFEDAAIPAEAAGLLLAVRAYRARAGLTAAPSP